MKVFSAKRRREKDGSVYWDETGFKVFQKTDGKMSIFDGRTGEFFPLFDQSQGKGGKSASTGNSDNQGSGRASAPPPESSDFDDDIPF